MKEFRNILYLLGNDPGMADGLWRALELARGFGATLTVGVHSPLPGEDARTTAGMPVRGQGPGLELSLAPVDRETVARMGDGGSRRPYDLVVKPAGAAAGLRNRLFGSPDRELFGTSPAPVWLLGPADDAPVGPVLAAVDVGNPALEPLNRRIVGLASSLAALRGAELRLVHAWTLCGEGYARIPAFTRSERQLPRILDAVRRERRLGLLRLTEDVPADAPVRIELHKGRPARVISEVVARTRAALVVTGASTHHGMAGLFMMNTAEAILGRVPCDVLALGPGTAPARPRAGTGIAPERDPRPGSSSPRPSTETARHGR